MEYPRRVTVAMTEDLYKGLLTQINIKNMTGDLMPEYSEIDLIILGMIRAIEEQWSTPVYIRSIEEIKKSRKEKKSDG